MYIRDPSSPHWARFAWTRAAEVGPVLFLAALCFGWLVLHYPANALPFAVGLALGATLYLSEFGFASAYRRLFVLGDTSGLIAQCMMVALATLLFAPFLSQGSLFGRPVGGAVAPIGWTVGAGAFAFGIGMQLASGCASGTLYALGEGRLRPLLVLIAFCAGGFWASLDMGRWPAVFAGEPVVLGETIGWVPAAGIQAATLLLGSVLLWVFGRHTGSAAPRFSWERLAQGPWRLILGGLLLAVLNLGTLAVAGHPWTITWGFTLWGAKLAAAAGWDPATSPFWGDPALRETLRGSVLGDVTSVMNLGIVGGAYVASVGARRIVPHVFIPWRSAAAALIGGVAMGYGARIAYGCNIGAFFSGAASTSLHGWLWFLCALPGNWIGVKLRPYFALSDS